MLRTLRNPAAAASAGTRTLPRLEKPLTQAAVKLNSQTLQEMPPSLCRSINQSRAEYRRLGNSGLRISNPILGGMHIGTSKWFDWVLDEGQAIALLKEAYDRGINTWDTANVYSNGESERVMGKALRVHRIPRHKVVLMTKCFRPVTDPDVDPNPGSIMAMFGEAAQTSKDYVNQCGLSRAAIFKQVQDSLERLETDYIDVLQIHRFDHNVPPEETMKALHDLIQANKVRYIGASSMWAHEFAILQQVAERNGWTKFVSMQNHYNLLYREEEREMNKYCNMTGGAIYAADNAAESEEILRRAHCVAEARGWPMSHVALAWLNKRVTAPIIGFSSAARMDEALGARDKILGEMEEQYLEEPYRPQRVQGHS
ncbi:ammonium transporter Amt2 [Neofusicoccum ribis]|uniref:Ammonium transporter Amt2 n=1 Tax=Neofusicoccum ribis TaxID=45134 RepID=A0ABR3SXH9_9PEZI